jgi:hypothetical protein
LVPLIRRFADCDASPNRAAVAPALHAASGEVGDDFGL